MEHVDRCNLCEGSRFSLFSKMFGPLTKKAFCILRCDGCGIMFVSPRLSAEENKALYDEAYFNGEGFDSTVNYVRLDQLAETRQGENAGIIEKIRVLMLGRKVRVMDVGCGTGSLLRALEAAGYDDLWGIELSAYAAEMARRTTCAQVLTGDVLNLQLPEGSVDVVNATEVIEHLRDPLAFFRRVKSLLRPGGVFIYSTGNARGLYARVLGARWPYLHPEGHLFYYTPNALSRYFEKVGLRTLDVDALDRRVRGALLSAEDLISHSQLRYLGQSHSGATGWVFRLMATLDVPPMSRAVTLVVGKHRLPIAVN